MRLRRTDGAIAPSVAPAHALFFAILARLFGLGVVGLVGGQPPAVESPREPAQPEEPPLEQQHHQPEESPWQRGRTEGDDGAGTGGGDLEKKRVDGMGVAFQLLRPALAMVLGLFGRKA